MKYLLLWLEGPLQSWGDSSLFDRRDTLPFPTKSGVLGLILASIGAGGEQEELLSQVNSLEHLVFAYGKEKKRGNEVDFVPVSILEDFHMIGSGYRTDDTWEMAMIPHTRGGELATNVPGNKQTYRQYLQDAVFAVICELPDDVAIQAEVGLKAPVWPIYLGRKTCQPSKPVFRGVFSSKEEAIVALEDGSEGYTRLFRVIEGAYPDIGQVYTLSDVPIRFGMDKAYGSRYVTRIQYENCSSTLDGQDNT